MPEPRDQSEEADAAFRSPIPARLTEYLAAHRDTLHPELRRRWEKVGARASGSWEEVFGDGPEGQEVFSTWHYATYIDAVAAAGKAAYDLPMYVNAWIAGAGKPGSYPTGGPVAHMHDVWRAAAPHIDLLAPDIYLSDFKGITAEHVRGSNPLFIPEAAPDAEAAARAYWAFASRDALGFSPFGIESVDPGHPLVATYGILRQLLPVVASAQGTGRMVGIYRQAREDAPGSLKVGSYRAEIRYQDRLPVGHPPVGGLVVQTSDGEFLVAGYGIEVRFGATTPGPRHTEILSVELGHFDGAGVWAHELWFNGDETGANYTARIPPSRANMFLGAARPMILKVKVYRHDCGR